MERDHHVLVAVLVALDCHIAGSRSLLQDILAI